MNRSLLAGAAGLLSLLPLGTAVAEAAPVTVRVESPQGSVVARTVVDPAGVGTLTRDNTPCTGTNTAAGALELATGGDWDGSDYGFGLSVDRIKATTLPLVVGAPRFWGLYVNGVLAGAGACGQPVQAGDDVLFSLDCGDSTVNCFQNGVLTAAGPTRVQPGVPFRVTVGQTITTFGPAPDFTPTTTRAAANGAAVSGGGASATTGADGAASVTLTQPGPAVLRVTRAQQTPDTVPVCVSNGADGFCGTTVPGAAAPAGGVPATPTPDTVRPAARLTGVKDKQRFSRRRAPRRIDAKVSDASGLQTVKLSLTRRVGKRCTAFSGRTERFKRIRCGTHPVFALETAGDVDFLLPERLGKGRYTLDVVAKDKAGNRSPLKRGVNRAVFVVR